MSTIVQRTAVKALIINKHGAVLLLQKSNDDIRHAGKSGRYNLPGGKINPGEHIADALIREIHEETGITIRSLDTRPLFAGEWTPVVRGQQHQIIGIFYSCHDWSGDITLDSEHASYVWLTPDNLDAYDILPPEDEALATFFSLQAYA